MSFTVLAGKTVLSDGGCGGGKTTDDRGQNRTEERGTTTEVEPRNVNFIDARRVGAPR